MSIWNRLGSVINSYFNDFGAQTNKSFRSSGDPDFNAAYEELDDYLNNNEPKAKKEYAWQDAQSSVNIPEELRADFELLGVPFGADSETCKSAYKKLLKVHHPDRHAGHEGNYKKATEKSAKINAAWDRIEKWRTQK
ncbi:MAG: J domain-containing protein [Treponema sp.]|jgi:DnaJ-domain-containing protein 1|nr:J domain-containing protein [Treponema sp.]